LLFIKRLFISLSTRLPGSLLEMKVLFDIVFRVFTRGPRNCRSLGFARDDKKERAAVHRELLLNRGISSNLFGQLLLNLTQGSSLLG
jgi:hypothetical protein